MKARVVVVAGALVIVLAGCSAKGDSGPRPTPEPSPSSSTPEPPPPFTLTQAEVVDALPREEEVGNLRIRDRCVRPGRRCAPGSRIFGQVHAGGRIEDGNTESANVTVVAADRFQSPDRLLRSIRAGLEVYDGRFHIPAERLSPRSYRIGYTGVGRVSDVVRGHWVGFRSVRRQRNLNPQGRRSAASDEVAYHLVRDQYQVLVEVNLLDGLPAARGLAGSLLHGLLDRLDAAGTA